MCTLQTRQALLASRSATLVGTLHLFCVFCAILQCACSNVDHQHQHRSNSTPIHSHYPHPQQSSSSSSPPFTSKSLLKSSIVIDNSKKYQQDNFSNYEQRRLHRFNQRFSSMRQCQLPSSGCECLWSVKHLRGMLQAVESDQSNHTDQHNHGLNEYEEGSASTIEEKEGTAAIHRQMAVIMMSNVLKLGKLVALGENDWFKCSAKASICEQQQQQNQSSSYSHNRVLLLSTLMPNMASGDQSKQRSSSSEEHHHHHSEEHLSSIELFTDIESLLRQINHLLAIDQRANDDNDQKKKCFDREDLLDDYQQMIAEDTSGRKTADHHDHDHHHHQHEAPLERAVNLLYIEHLTNIIVNRLASGECIELFETKFLRDIISRYGTAQSLDSQQLNSSSNQSITTLEIHQDGFVKLLNDLHIGGLIENNATTTEKQVGDERDEHEHHHDVAHHRHDHSNSSSVASALKQSSSANFRGHRSITSVSPTASHNHIGHHHEHYQSYQQTTPQQQQQQSAHQHQLKKPRSSAVCLDYHYYLHRQGAGADKRKPLTAADLRELSPIFIQQILSGACEQLEPEEIIVGVPTTTTTRTSKMHRGGSMDAVDNLLSPSLSSPHQLFNIIGEDVWKIYVYSGISVAIISISSICGVLMIPFLKTSYYTHIINLLIGLAFSSMAGDALLHLLPTVLGIHSHSEGEDGESHNHSHRSAGAQHDHHHDEHKPLTINYMGLMIAILATIYALFLFEIFSNYFASKRTGGGDGGHSHGHSHSHQQPTYKKNNSSTTNEYQSDYQSAVDTPTLTKVTTTDNSDQQATYSSSSTITSILTNADQEMVSHAHHRHPHHQHSEEQLYKSSSAVESQKNAKFRAVDISRKENSNMPVIFGMTSLALIITIGDSIHNLLDGVAIGIAFSNSIASGISTSIAVLFHELPHEFGDFAVLLSTGLSVRRAAVINFLSALTAFIGLYIGILLGNNEEANRWALAICAGLFLYVALVDMLPELKEMPSTENGSSTWVISLLVKNVGILTGAGFMILLAKYEDLLKFA